MVVDHLKNPPFRHIVLRLLYHFSMEDGFKSLLAYYQGCITMLLQLLVHFPEQRVGEDLVALCVNLATEPRAAEVMVKSGLFPQVVVRALRTRDHLLCKVIRHVSSHEAVRQSMYNELMNDSARMGRWMHEFVRMLLGCVDSPDLLVEVLGILSNMDLPEVDWGDIIEAGLLDLFHRLLVAGFSDDDILLDCVILVGVVSLDQEAVASIATSRVPGMLQNLLVTKGNDEEMVQQLLFTFRCLLAHEEACNVVLQELAELANTVMSCTSGLQRAVLEQASELLQVIAEWAPDELESGSTAEQVRAFRFELHNAEWCQFAQQQEAQGGLSPGSPGSAEGFPSPRGFFRKDAGTLDEEEEFAYRSGNGSNYFGGGQAHNMYPD